MIIIYHNPICLNANRCIKILETNFKEDHEIKRESLELTEEKLKEILNLLKCKPIDIIRTNQEIWKTLFKFLSFSDDELIKIMLKFPILIKGPIVINGNKAIIGRPPELILDIL